MGKRLEQLNAASPARDMGLGTLDSGLGTRLDRDLGVERDGPTLQQLVADLPDPESECAESGCVISGLAARSALLREESRGAHYRTDAPNTSPAWQVRILWRSGSPPQFEEVHNVVENRV